MRTTLGLLLVSVLAADEIHLADGRVLEGEVRTQGATATIRARVAGMNAEIQVPAGEISRVVPGPTKTEQARQAFFSKRAALTDADQRLPQPAAVWWALAQEAKAADEPKAMRECARVVIERDPDHVQARALLGQVRQDGRWMTPDEAAIARGEVWFRGRWTAIAVRDAILAEEARASAEATERLAQRRAERAAAAQASSSDQGAATQIYFGTTTVIPLAPAYYCNPAYLPVARPLPACRPPGLSLHVNGQRPGLAWDLTVR